MKSKRRQKVVSGFAAAILLSAAICQAQSGWSIKRIISGGKDLNAVYFTDEKHGWVGGDGGFFSHTDDGGATWSERRIGTEQAINDISFVSKDSGFALAGGSIFSTDDGGHSWVEEHKFTSTEFEGATPELYSLRFKGRKRGWVVGSVSRGETVTNSILAMTKDGGKNWVNLGAPTREELIHIDFADEKHGWIVGVAGTILYTEDAGESWTKQNSGTDATLYHVNFRSEKQGWAVGERGTIVRTVDGGRSWSPADSPVRSTLLSVQFISEDEGWIVGRGGVILRSANGGRTWIEQESGTKLNLFALFVSKKNGWAVGTAGLIVRYER